MGVVSGRGDTLGKLTIVLVGMCGLLAWMLHLATMSFYLDVYRDHKMILNMVPLFSVIFMTTSFVFNCIANTLLNIIGDSVMILLGFLLNLLVFVFMGSLLVSDAYSNVFSLYIVITCFAVSSLGSSMSQSATYSYVGGHMPNMIKYVQIGEGWAGFVPSLLQLTIILVSRTITVAAWEILLYYIIASALFVFTIILVSILRYRTLGYDIEERREETRLQTLKDVNESTENLFLEKKTHVDIPKYTSPTFEKYIDMIKTCWEYIVSLFLTLSLTLLIFPTIIFMTQSTYISSEKSNVLFYATKVFVPLLLLVYNIGDLIGRFLGGKTLYIKGKYKMLGISIARIIYFLPIYLSGNIVVKGVNPTRAWLASDAITIAVTALLGITNGVLVVSVMSGFSEKISTIQGHCEHIDKYAAFMVLVIKAALTTGAIEGVWLSKILSSSADKIIRTIGK